jgi:hypothetical protein
MYEQIENLVVVYWSEDNNKPVYNFSNKNVKDVDEFAKIVVPPGVHYNIVHKDEIYQPAVPPLSRNVLNSNEQSSLFYQYLNSL